MIIPTKKVAQESKNGSFTSIDIELIVDGNDSLKILIHDKSFYVAL